MYAEGKMCMVDGSQEEFVKYGQACIGGRCRILMVKRKALYRTSQSWNYACRALE